MAEGSPVGEGQDTLPWTGERYVPSVGGVIRFEHIHRYTYALPFCENKIVLDVASGEGYGTFMLSGVAAQTIGIDNCAEAQFHAMRTYKNANLAFLVADCTAIPLMDSTIDVVTSFETIEHILDQQGFLNEISRVLRPNGLLIISSPERLHYGNSLDQPNPYHKKELTSDAFFEILSLYFTNVHLAGQLYMEGSIIDSNARSVSNLQFDARISDRSADLNFLDIENLSLSADKITTPHYMIGVASNERFFKPAASILTGSGRAGPRLAMVGDLGGLVQRQAEQLASLNDLVERDSVVLGSLREILQLLTTIVISALNAPGDVKIELLSNIAGNLRKHISCEVVASHSGKIGP